MRHLAIATVITFLGLFATACGSTPSSSPLPDASNGQFDATAGCSPSNCDDSVACTVDRCESGSCTHTPDSSQCSTGQTCNARGCMAARPCAVDRDCADQDPCTTHEQCDRVTRVCITQPFDGDEDGYAPRSCGGNDCNDDDATLSPMAPERCNNSDDNCNGQIDENADGSCEPGTYCRAGQCVCRMTCGAECSDPMTDQNNCGQCGNRCPMGTLCIGGRCGCPAAAPDLCDGECVSLQRNSFNCGACGHSCVGGVNPVLLTNSCVAGECQCPSSFTTCMVGGRRTCTDLRVSREHCGACGHQCPVPANGSAVCNGGVCGIECAAGSYQRGSECVRAACEGFRGRCDPLNDLGCDEGEHCAEMRIRSGLIEYECLAGDPGTRAATEVCSPSDRCQRGLICAYFDERPEGFCYMPCCGPMDTRCGTLTCGGFMASPPPYGHFCFRRG